MKYFTGLALVNEVHGAKKKKKRWCSTVGMKLTTEDPDSIKILANILISSSN